MNFAIVMHKRMWATVRISLMVLVGNGFEGSLHFDQPLYEVPAGQTFQVHLLLDMDDEAVGDQVPASGIFSFGVRVNFDAGIVVSNGVAGIQLPEELDGDGAGGLALKRVEAGALEAAGAVNFAAVTRYPNARVLTINLDGLDPGTYTLTPALLWSEPQVNFLDFTGTELEPQITAFQPATIQVRTEADLEITEFMRLDGTTLQIDFTGSDVAPTRYSVERSKTVVPLVWDLETTAVIERRSIGVFRATLSTGVRTSALYRVYFE